MPQKIDYAALADGVRGGGKSATGLLEPGNVDMATRPRVKNKDGTVSTVRSMSVNMDGREVLIPTVSDDGRIMSDGEAVANSRHTGKHLGMFDTPDNATAFAQRLHESEAAKLTPAFDYAALADQARTLYDPKRKPVSAEDFTDPVEASAPMEFSKGVLKGATSSLAGLGEMLANAGMLPGVRPNAFGPEEMRHPTFRRVEEATTATNTAQRAGKAAEFVAELAAPSYQLGKAGVALARSAPKLGSVALEVASHVPVIGGPVRMARGAAKILGHVLDLSPRASNKGGRLVTSSAASIEDDLARALEEFGRPELPQSVELPPPAELPPGYVPRADVPLPSAPPINAGGRLVPPQTPSTTQALADALAEVRAPELPARITTPPPASLPAGYTPRTTVPKPKVAAASVPSSPATAPARTTPAAARAAEPKRAYFLKPVETLAAEAEAQAVPRVSASGSITPNDLPRAWRSHTGQDLFPMTGIEGKVATDALLEELTSRGVSVGEAMASISRNKSLPTKVRAQLMRALSKVPMKQAAGNR